LCTPFSKKSQDVETTAVTIAWAYHAGGSVQDPGYTTHHVPWWRLRRRTRLCGRATGTKPPRLTLHGEFSLSNPHPSTTTCRSSTNASKTLGDVSPGFRPGNSSDFKTLAHPVAT